MRKLQQPMPSTTWWRRGRLSPVLVLVIVAAIVAHGELSIKRTLAQAPPAIDVEMGDYYFEPKEIMLPAGTAQLTFTNRGTRKHNFVVKVPEGGLRIPDVDAGKSFEASFTFASPGTYDFLCDLPTHASRGMTGTLTISTTGANSTASPQTEAAAGATTTSSAAGQTPPTAPRSAQGTGRTPATGSTSGSASGFPVFISLAFHIPAAITWLGIVLFDAIVVAVPYLSPSQRAALLRRPKWLVLMSIPIFMVTGVFQTIYNPITTVTDLTSLEALRANTTYGLALFWKHGFVLTSVVLTLGVTFWLAPRLAAATAATAATDETNRSPQVSDVRRRLPVLLAWANVACCAALLLCVAVIVFQLH